MTVQVSIKLPCSAERSSFISASLYDGVQFCAASLGELPRGCALPDVLCPNAVGTPFESGVFKMKLVLGSDFPNVPPKGEQRCSIPKLTLL